MTDAKSVFESENKPAALQCLEIAHLHDDTGTGHGATFQISLAYCEIVRSLEKRPEAAMLRMALRAHPSRLA